MIAATAGEKSTFYFLFSLRERKTFSQKIVHMTIDLPVAIKSDFYYIGQHHSPN